MWRKNIWINMLHMLIKIVLQIISLPTIYTAQVKYQESIAKAKEMENGACKDYASVNVLYAYDYNKLGDSTAAYNAIQKYFASNPDTSNIQPKIMLLQQQLPVK